MSVRQLKGNKVTKDGRSWAFIAYNKGLDGKRHQYQSPAFYTKKEAEEAEKAYLLKYKDLDCNPHMTFKEACDIHYEYQKDKVTDSTMKTYRDRMVYMALFNNVELVDLNWDLYQKWRKEMNKTDLADKYKNDIQKYLKQILNFAEKQWDFNLRKFYTKIEPFKTPGALKKEMKFYEPEEFYKFISVITDLRDRCLFKTFYYCGLRRSEARGLQWKHIDFKNHTLTVAQQVLNPATNNANGEWYIASPKTESSNRTIPIPDVLMKDLEQLKKNNQLSNKYKNTWFVFGDAEPISYHQIYYSRDKYVKQSGVKHIRIHDFRHSCVSALVSNSAPITAISGYLGHSETTETLETYTHLFKKDMANVPIFFDNLEQKYIQDKTE